MTCCMHECPRVDVGGLGDLRGARGGGPCAVACDIWDVAVERRESGGWVPVHGRVCGALRFAVMISAGARSGWCMPTIAQLVWVDTSYLVKCCTNGRGRVRWCPVLYKTEQVPSERTSSSVFPSSACQTHRIALLTSVYVQRYLTCLGHDSPCSGLLLHTGERCGRSLQALMMRCQQAAPCLAPLTRGQLHGSRPEM